MVYIYMYMCTVWLPHWQPKREKINSNRLMQLGRRSGLLGACTVLQQPAGARGTSETEDDDDVRLPISILISSDFIDGMQQQPLQTSEDSLHRYQHYYLQVQYRTKIRYIMSTNLFSASAVFLNLNQNQCSFMMRRSS